MSRSTAFRQIAGASLIVIGATGSSVVQQPTRSTEIDADSLSFDFETRTTVAANFRFTNGNVSISAAEGRRVAGGGDATEDWSLIGDVVVAVDSALARAGSASVRFSSGRLISGELVGDPVSIERPGEEPFRGSANRIAYDDAEGVFSATGNATFSYGTQEVRCDWIYDVRQRTARGFASGDEGCKYLRRQNAP